MCSPTYSRMLVIVIFCALSIINCQHILSLNSYDCWWSGCQPRFWLYRGCYPTDQYRILKSLSCPISKNNQTGDAFFCCPHPESNGGVVDKDELDNNLEESESGICSWYGGSDIPQGSPTASGEKFDKFALTAAHRTLPFGTRIRVKNSKNGKTADVVINDRGPFIQRRILDLSYAAFGNLEDHDKGLFHCSYVIL